MENESILPWMSLDFAGINIGSMMRLFYHLGQIFDAINDIDNCFPSIFNSLKLKPHWLYMVSCQQTREIGVMV